MKKNFENPVMNVSLFDMADIVTTSGEVTNLQAAEQNVAGVKNLTTADFSALKFEF